MKPIHLYVQDVLTRALSGKNPRRGFPRSAPPYSPDQPTEEDFDASTPLRQDEPNRWWHS